MADFVSAEEQANRKNSKQPTNVTRTTTNKKWGGDFQGYNPKVVETDPAYTEIYRSKVKEYTEIHSATGTTIYPGRGDNERLQVNKITEYRNADGSIYYRAQTPGKEPGTYNDLPWPPVREHRGSPTYRQSTRAQFRTPFVEISSHDRYKKDVLSGKITPSEAVINDGMVVNRVPIEEETTVSSKPLASDKRSVTKDSTDIRSDRKAEDEGVSNGQGGTSPNPTTDPDKVAMLVFPEKDDSGNPIKGTNGIKYVTKDEIEKLDDQGRVKSSLKRTALMQLRGQEKAVEKGNWPVPEGKGLSSMGDLVDDEDQNNIYSKSSTKGPANNTEATTTNNVTPQEVRLGETASGVAGVPASNKVRLFTKDASALGNEQDGGFMGMLTRTGNGIMFPYTPTINWGHVANYGTYDIVHSNYQPHFYNMTTNPSISITATFSANTTTEAAYAIASLHFLKWATKSDFGAFLNGPGTARNTDAGTPPPVLMFSGYGSANAKNVPVIVKNINYTFPEDVDYVTVGTPGRVIAGVYYTYSEVQQMNVEATEFNDGEYGAQRTAKSEEMTTIPTTFVVQIELGIQYPPSYIRDNFSIKNYANGELLKNKGII